MHTILQSQFSGRRSRYFVQAKLIQKAKKSPTLESCVSEIVGEGLRTKNLPVCHLPECHYNATDLCGCDLSNV